MKRTLTLILAITMVIISAGCASPDYLLYDIEQFYGADYGNLINNTNPPSEETESTLRYSNNDYVYHPPVESIDFDEEEGVIFFNNLLVVYTFTNLSEAEAYEVAASVDGIVVGKISGSINVIQVKVSETDLNGLNKKSEILMESDNILFAGYDYPTELSSSNTWSKNILLPETDLNNESKPKGNDWWAEAVGAYTAWENVGSTENIKVGILDSGFDTDHEDLNGKISFLDDYQKNSEENHGTHVAGLVGANNNTVGIRGIADNAELICCDWSPNDATSESKIDYLGSGEYVKILNQFVDNGAKVINNSWSRRNILSKNEYAKALSKQLFNKENKTYNLHKYLLGCLVTSSNGSYDQYINFSKTFAKRLASDNMFLIVQLLVNNKEDFLFVQAAGNGYVDCNGEDIKEGHDASLIGDFCAIDAELYNTFEYKIKSYSKKDITYETIDDHIIIVGAINNKRTKNGDYKMAEFSNIGNYVDICAPGQEIFSTIVDNTYDNMNGTSMAAPIVAGSAALLWSAYPNLSVGEVKQTLINTAIYKAVGVGDDTRDDYPIVNIGNAILTMNSQQSSSYYWAVEPTIEADDIIITDRQGLNKESDLAVIEKNGKYGFIDYDGDILLDCEFETYHTWYGCGLVALHSKFMHQQTFVTINNDNTPVYAIHSHGCGTTPMYKYENNEVRYNGIFWPKEGTAIAVQNTETGKYALFDNDIQLTDFVYDDGHNPYYGDYVGLCQNGKWAYFDADGNKLLDFEFLEVGQHRKLYDFSGNLVAVRNSEGYGYYNSNGECIIPCGEFECARPVQNGKAWVKQNGKWGVICIDAFENVYNTYYDHFITNENVTTIGVEYYSERTEYAKLFYDVYNSYENTYILRMFMFDLDKDGTDEMFIETGANEPDRKIEAFTFLNDQCISMGTLKSWHGRFYISGDELIMCDMASPECMVHHLYSDNGKLASTHEMMNIDEWTEISENLPEPYFCNDPDKLAVHYLGNA